MARQRGEGTTERDAKRLVRDREKLAALLPGGAITCTRCAEKRELWFAWFRTSRT